MKLLWILPFLLCSAYAQVANNCHTTTGTPFTVGTGWVCLQQNSAAPSTNSMAIAFNSNVTAGSVLIAGCFYNFSTTPITSVTATDTRSNTWTMVAGPQQGGTGYTNEYNVILIAYNNASSGADTITFVGHGGTGTDNNSGCSIDEFQQPSYGTPVLDGTGYGISGTSSGTCAVTFFCLNLPNVTTVQANEMVYYTIDANSYASTCNSPCFGLDGEVGAAAVFATASTHQYTGNDTVTGDGYVSTAIALKNPAAGGPPRMSLVGVGP